MSRVQTLVSEKHEIKKRVMVIDRDLIGALVNGRADGDFLGRIHLLDESQVRVYLEIPCARINQSLGGTGESC